MTLYQRASTSLGTSGSLRLLAGLSRLLVALAALWSVPLLASDGQKWPIETSFEGPIRFCSSSYSIDVGPGEKVEVSDPGLDFIVSYLVSPKGGFGIYEGNAPQDDGSKVRTRPGWPFPTWRLKGEQNQVSYLIRVSGKPLPSYIHAFGQAFTGKPSDLALLRRLTINPSASAGCGSRTYSRPRS